MPIGSGRVGGFGVKATPGIKGPHKGIALRSPALSQVKLGIDSVATFLLDATTTTSLPSQLTLTATGTRNYFDASGIIQSAASGVARFDNKPAGSAWIPAGLLLEEQRTNSCFQAYNPQNASWLVVGATKAGGLADLLGGTNGQTVTATAGTGGHDIEIDTIATLTAGVTYTMRVYIGQGTSPAVAFGDFSDSVNFIWGALKWSDMSLSTNGTANSQSIAGPYFIGIYGGTPVYAVDLTWTRDGTGAGGVACANYPSGVGALGGANSINYTAAGTETFKFYGCQVEAVTAPKTRCSSPILTTTAAVTRSADILTSTDATLLAARAWVVETGEVQPATASTLLGVNTITALGENTSNQLTTADGGTQTSVNTADWASVNRGGIAWDATPRVSIDLDGVTAVTAANTPLTPTNLYFGNTNNGASGFLNSHIRVLASYAALTDSQLATISVPGAPIATAAPTNVAVGAAAGTSTVAAVGASLAASTGAAAGTSTVAAVGASLAAATGAAAGTSTVTATGNALFNGVGSATGTSTVTATGAALGKGVGNAAGTSTVLATGQSTAASVGASAGSSTVSGVGAALAASVGSAAGTSTDTATGSSLAKGIGNAAGTSTASGVSGTVGVAAGTSTVTGVGSALFKAVGAAAGTSTVTATGVGAAFAAGVSSGTSTVSGIGKSLAVAVGSAAGIGTAAGLSPSQIMQAVGLATGNSIVVGVGNAHRPGTWQIAVRGTMDIQTPWKIGNTAIDTIPNVPGAQSIYSDSTPDIYQVGDIYSQTVQNTWKVATRGNMDVQTTWKIAR